MIACSNVQAQTLFMAYKITGKVFQIKKGQQISFKTGNYLNENDSIIVGPNSSVVFICNKLSLLELSRQQLYPLKKFTSSCKSPANSYAAEYFAYILEAFGKVHDKPEEHRKKYMNNLGGIVRGDCGGITFENYIDSVRYCFGNFSLRWKLLNTVGTASIVFNSTTSERPAFSLPVKNNSFSVSNLSKEGLTEDAYTWKMNIAGVNDCQEKYFELWSKTEFDKLITHIEKNFDEKLQKAEKNYRIGFYLERMHFFGEALYYYQKALKHSPSNELYKKTSLLVAKTYKLY